MVCWEVNTLSVEFKAKYKNVLLQALREMNLSWTESRSGVIWTSYFDIDLKNQKVKYIQGQEDRLSQLRMKYTEVATRAMTKKKRWIVKDNPNEANAYTLVKY